MRAYTYFMVIISTAILLALGVFALLYTSGLLSSSIISYFKGEGKWALSLTGAIFILLSLGEMYAGGKILREEPAVSFDNPLGEVRISYSAIEDYIQRLVSNEIKGVKRVRTKVNESHAGVGISVRVEVKDGEDIPRLANGLQERVSSYIKDVLGITSLSQVKVHVARISSGREESNEEETS